MEAKPINQKDRPDYCLASGGLLYFNILNRAAQQQRLHNLRHELGLLRKSEAAESIEELL